VRLVTERNWGNSQFLKALVLGIHNQVLSLNCKEFGVHPSSEELFVWGCIPWVLFVLESLLEFDLDTVRLDLGQTEKLLIDILVGVGVWAS